MDINTQKFLPSSKGSALQVAKGGALKVISKSISKSSSGGLVSESITKNLSIISAKVIKINDILKGTLALEKKKFDDKKKQESGKRREKIEEKLEKKTSGESSKLKMPQLPKMGFLDWIKNYISNILIGYFAVRLIEHLPKLIPVVSMMGKATDFAIDFGGKMLNGLVSFIDWGYKAYDATRGFLKNIGGENFAKIFDGFSGAVGTLIDTAIIAATVLATQGEGGVLDVGGDMIGDWLSKRFAQQGAQRAAQAGTQLALPSAGGTSASGTASLGAGAVAGVIAGAGLLASALGEGAFQLRKIAIKPIQDAKKAFDNEKNPLMKIGRGALLGGMYMLLGPLSAVGVLLDVVGAPFRYAIELLRFPFLSDKDKQKQAGNLAKFDSRIREDFRKALNMVTLGFAFKQKGSFGNIYGNKGAQSEMMNKMQGGGFPITRGGKVQGAVQRTLPKQKYKRDLKKKPSRVQFRPGIDVGGEENVKKIFPKATKPGEISPFDTIKTSGEELGKSDYFGPILSITSKILLGQKPEQKDYDNVGLGINLLIAKGIDKKQLTGGIAAAFADGGLVEKEITETIKGDISGWISKTFKEATETNAQKTIREIQRNLKLKRKEKETPKTGQDGGGGGGYSEGGITGSGVDKAVSVAKKLMVDLGVTPAQAAGIVGNFLYESAGMNPGEVEGAPFGVPESPPPLGTVGVGYGWAQWTNSRPGDRLDKFLKSYGGDKGKIATDDDNYRFLMSELKGSESIKGMPTSDPQAASDWFRVNWERAGVPADEKRRRETMAVYNKIKGLSKEQAKEDVIKSGGVISSGPDSTKIGSKVVEGVDDFTPLAKQFGLNQTSGYRPGDSGWHGTNRARDYQTAGAPGNAGTSGQLRFAKYLYENYGSRLKQLIYTPLGFGVDNGKKVPLSHWGPVTKAWAHGGGNGTNAIHYDHVHVAYEKGGRVHKPTFAIIGEKGQEFVFDADTTKGLDHLAPGLLEKLNIAKTKPQLSSILQTYASYESQEPEVVVVPVNNVISNSGQGYDSSGDSSSFFVGGGDNPFDNLYIGW